MTIPTMQENLAYFTKDELTAIMIRLGMQTTKKSAKKAEMIEHIAAHMDDCWENLLLQFTLEQVDAVADYLTKGQKMSPEMEDDEDLEDGLITLFLNGLASGRETGSLVDPRVLAHFQLDEGGRAEMRLQNSLFDYMMGWLVHVGMMPADELAARAAALTESEEPERSMIHDLCAVLLFVRGDKCEPYVAPDESLWAVHADLEDPDSLYGRLQERYIAELPYPDFDEDLLAEAGWIGLPGEPKLYQKLLEWLELHNVVDAVGPMVDAVLLAQNNQTNEGIRLILDIAQPRGEKEIKQLVNLVVDVFNGMPSWVCKGHAPEEMFRRESRRSAKMPGRNDPCTCGSGRKYKNCCGKHVN